LARAIHSPTFQLFHRAILGRQQVVLTYHGHHREVCPYVLGHKDRHEKVLVYQFAGTSEGGGKIPDWRCFYLSEIENPQIRSGPWHGDAAHRKSQSCVDDVYIDANTEVPDQPGRRFRLVE
jgi:predicted DNA-binding transcriptional regulator YafY